MQNRLIAGLMAVLILSSCTSIFGDHRNSLASDSANVDYSAGATSAEIKFHRPGEAVDSTETLTWSPNNLSEYATIQFTILVHNLPNGNNIEEVDIIGSWISNGGQLFEQFRLELTSFSVIEGPNFSTITQNYSYPNSVWGGSYSIDAEIRFANGDLITTERTDFEFTSNSYYFGYANPTDVNYLCSCEKKRLSLTIKNTGEDETEFFYSVNLTQILEDVELEWSAASEDVSDGSIIAGDFINLDVKILVSDNIKTGALEIPIYVEVYFENDDGAQIYLARERILITAIILDEEVYPNVEIPFDEFDFKLSFLDGEQPRLPEGMNATLFSHGSESLLFEMSISNTGYYDRQIRIDNGNTRLDYRVLTDNYNISLAEFNTAREVVVSQTTNHYTIMIENLANIQHETVNLDISFNESSSTLISFAIGYQPIISEAVFSQSPSFDAELSTPITFNQKIQIDLSAYENYLFFNNHWSLICSMPHDISIYATAFDTECNNQGIEINYSKDAEQLSDFTISITISDNYPNETATIELTLRPIVIGKSSPLLHSMTIDIPIELTEQDPEDNDPVNNDENNNTDGNDSVDNTTEEDSNSTIDANTDTDGDGVIDTLDACPNTASGITVDEFGCQVIEQDINDEEDETTANPTDAEGNSEQKTDDAATQTDENNVVIYLIIGSIAVAIVGALLFLNSRGSANKTEPSTKTLQPIASLPTLPLPSMEPVVLQQWTDANGYSWRQMSDQSIMWWNGSDWIPYGKN